MLLILKYKKPVDFPPIVQTIAQDFIKEAQAKYKDKIVVEVNVI